MDFHIAAVELLDGKKVRRKTWEKGFYLFLDVYKEKPSSRSVYHPQLRDIKDKLVFRVPNTRQTHGSLPFVYHSLTAQDVFADDWEGVK